MNLSRFVIVCAATAAIVVTGTGIASANPSEAVPSTSGFVDKAVSKPTCEDPALTFSGRYVGSGANLRLERKVEIEGGVTAWIPVANDGVSVYRNGRAVSGFGRAMEDGHVSVTGGDTFEVSQFNSEGLTQTLRLQLLMENNEFTEFGEQVVTFPLHNLCQQLENNELSATA